MAQGAAAAVAFDFFVCCLRHGSEGGKTEISEISLSFSGAKRAQREWLLKRMKSLRKWGWAGMVFTASSEGSADQEILLPCVRCSA